MESLNTAELETAFKQQLDRCRGAVESNVTGEEPGMFLLAHCGFVISVDDLIRKADSASKNALKLLQK